MSEELRTEQEANTTEPNLPYPELLEEARNAWRDFHEAPWHLKLPMLLYATELEAIAIQVNS